jgi:hypothetical protein
MITYSVEITVWNKSYTPQKKTLGIILYRKNTLITPN